MDWLLIRPFVSADQSAARRLILAGLADHFGALDETRNPDIDAIQAHYVEAGHTFLIAELGGEIVGTAALVCESVTTGRIVRVSVARAWRRQGIARQLVCRLVATAASAGLQRLWVETNHDWADAAGLYRALGFMEYARDQESVYLSLAP